MTRKTAFEPDEATIARDLVQRVGNGEAAAESELVQRYSRGLLFLLRRITGDSALADDLHQETFRVTLERLRGSGINEPERLAAFLRATGRNLFIGDYRKRVRRQTEGHADHLAAAADPAPSQLNQVLRDEEARLVRQLISELAKDRDRQMLYRFYIAEDDKKLICADLGLSDPHFNRVLFRARQRFKQLLERSRHSGSFREAG